jgi:hypothetical protein
MADDAAEVSYQGQRYRLVDLPPLTPAEERRSKRIVRVMVGRLWQRIIREYVAARALP